MDEKTAEANITGRYQKDFISNAVQLLTPCNVSSRVRLVSLPEGTYECGTVISSTT